MRRFKVITIMGTRPEAIKMAPVIRELKRQDSVFELLVVATAQHREMLDQVLSLFAISPDIDLGLMQYDQNLASFASRSLLQLSDLLTRVTPAAVLIQGDTTTVMTAALAASYQGVCVAHVEAGLRSFDRSEPFPEEINRRVTGCLADLHFAPTERARVNLLREGVADESIFVTGNTIVDALRSISLEGEFEDAALNLTNFASRRVLLVTAHRRENHGAPLRSICRALKAIVERFDDVEVVYPVHLNPNVGSVVRDELEGADRVHLVKPLSYKDLLRVIDRSCLILTDSGGIQEEAPSLGTPVLVLRQVTERPEVIEVGAGKLVGTDTLRILDEATLLLSDQAEYERMSSAENPFGDGHAAERIVNLLAEHLRRSRQPIPGAYPRSSRVVVPEGAAVKHP
jgi:UDP-N-acetylglucosamine 2-epimerase (non-hydrolysing)